jgi:hypothetical protein
LLEPLPLFREGLEPVEKFGEDKPQGQRYLQGDDAKKEEQQRKKLEQLKEAGQFAEALKVPKRSGKYKPRYKGRITYKQSTRVGQSK